MKSQEQFLEENPELKNLERLVLGDGKIASYFRSNTGQIKDNLADYVEIVEGAKDLKHIEVNLINGQEFFDGAKELVSRANDDVTISNQILGEASKEEFLKGEEIIDKLVSQIDPNWTAKQKLAFVHINMGKLVGYLPDYTPQMNSDFGRKNQIPNSRNTWKSLCNEVAVCNGITGIQRTVLSRVGVETEELTSPSHSFMLTKTEDGNVITDATWDLDFSLYGLRPQYFGTTLEDLDKIDAKANCSAHKLKEKPENVVGISDSELRDIYQSIGVINKDRKFESEFGTLITKLSNGEQKDLSIQEKNEIYWSEIAKKFGDKFSHQEECRKLFSLGVGTINPKGTKMPIASYIYKREDANFENPIPVIDYTTLDGKHYCKMIDSKNQRIEDLSKEDLKQYTYHEKNEHIQFWNQKRADLDRKQEDKIEAVEISQEKENDFDQK